MGALLGFIVPAGTPRAVVQKIQADTARALASPDVQKRAQDFGMQVVGSRPEQVDSPRPSHQDKPYVGCAGVAGKRLVDERPGERRRAEAACLDGRGYTVR